MTKKKKQQKNIEIFKALRIITIMLFSVLRQTKLYAQAVPFLLLPLLKQEKIIKTTISLST